MFLPWMIVQTFYNRFKNLMRYSICTDVQDVNNGGRDCCRDYGVINCFGCFAVLVILE